MFMLSSVGVKCLYRNIGRAPDIKKFTIHIKYTSIPDLYRNGFTKKISTSKCYMEKSETKNDNKDGKEYEIKLKTENNKDLVKTLKSAADIVVKAETDKSQVVTKVTIEKVKPDVKPPPSRYL